MLQAAARASKIRRKALAQLTAVRSKDAMRTDPEDEVIVHRMLEAYFQHYERIAAEHDAPAIGREIADQRRAWAEQQRLAGLGPTWLLEFATEGELNSIVKSLEGEGSAEEITRATFERAAVRRWLTLQGHDIDEDDVQPRWPPTRGSASSGRTATSSDGVSGAGSRRPGDDTEGCPPPTRREAR